MKKFKIWQQGLLHSFLLWVSFELNDSITYWNRIRYNGPYIFNSDGSAVTQWDRFLNANYYQKLWLDCLFIAFFAELCYHYIFKRKSLPKYLTFMLPGAALLVLLNGWLSILKHGGSHIFTFMVPFLILSAYTLIYTFLRDYFQKQQDEKNRRIRQKESEIKVLKAQVNPHFFFNTLNTIYGTALVENAHRTAKCIDQLARIMRHTITRTGNDYTPLAEEAAFLEDYLQLQRLRIPDRENIRVETRISIDDPAVRIAPLLLLPFIENAFKYGISTEHPCKVKIWLEVIDKALRFQTENTCFKDQPGGLGTGIENVRQRLELIYPDRYQLSSGTDGTDFKVSLTLNLD